MQMLSRVAGWLIASLLLALPVAAQQPAASDPANEAQQQRAVSQPGNNAPVWRDVRSGAPNYTSAQGREAGVLIQPQARFPGQEVMSTAGEAWRSFRNGPITFYGGWLVVLVCVAVVRNGGQSDGGDR